MKKSSFKEVVIALNATSAALLGLLFSILSRSNETDHGSALFSIGGIVLAIVALGTIITNIVYLATRQTASRTKVVLILAVLIFVFAIYIGLSASMRAFGA